MSKRRAEPPSNDKAASSSGSGRNLEWWRGLLFGVAVDGKTVYNDTPETALDRAHARREAQPLAGLSIHLPRPVPPSVLTTIDSLGGLLAAGQSSTHCVVSPGLTERTFAHDPGLRRELRQCVAAGLTVVETSWVDEVAKLPPGGDWAAVETAPHVPPVLALCGTGEGEGEPPRRADRSGLRASLAETWEHVQRSQPEQAESDMLARAIEISLLDFALQLHDARQPAPAEDPRRVLGLPPHAAAAEVRQAYRRLALQSHPDRGGTPAAFLRLQRAYRTLMEEADPGGGGGGGETPFSAGEARPRLAGPRLDAELKEHRAVVEAWFERGGSDLESARGRLELALDALGLCARDLGATNRNESGEVIYNQCFYLSLARAFLRDEGEPPPSLVGETALHFKRVIETAVLRAHPEWAETQVGEDLQAFSDFLFYVIGGSNAMLSELAVAVFDSVSGGVEVYRGVHYPEGAQGSAFAAEECQRANLLCVRYVPGHYQALLPRPDAHGFGGKGPTLKELLGCLDACNVCYVVTDDSG